MADQIKLKLDQSENAASVELLQSVLKELKIETEYDSSNNVLKFSFDTSVIKKLRTRNAGAKVKELNDLYSMREIEEMQKTMTGAQIANAIGISRALYFKRLKEHREKGYRESDLF